MPGRRRRSTGGRYGRGGDPAGHLLLLGSGGGATGCDSDRRLSVLPRVEINKNRGQYSRGVNVPY